MEKRGIDEPVDLAGWDDEFGATRGRESKREQIKQRTAVGLVTKAPKGGSIG